MKHWLFVLLVNLSTLNLVLGQGVLQTEDQASKYAAIKQEKIFVHYNTSFLLTGEYLYYKIYCFENKEGHLSKLSKVAYVELVGKEGESIFFHKIILQNGLGHGDFFIPTNVASGTYKLIAYTNWMRNRGQTSFYQGDITIVNPYRTNQTKLPVSTDIQVDSLTITSDTLPQTLTKKETFKVAPPLQVTTNDRYFGKRSKVSLTLSGMDENRSTMGSYSISVRINGGIVKPLQENMVDFFDQANRSDLKTFTRVGDSIFLPELRGELFHGKVVALQKEKSVRNVMVAVSIPGDDYVLEIVQTDNLGNFQFNVAKRYSGQKLLLQVLSKNPEAFKVQLLKDQTLNYFELDFEEIDMDFSIKEEVLRRSIHNQIENSYFQFRPDSIVAVSPEHFFDTKDKKAYMLGDYTSFKTLRETLVEIIQDVSSKRIGKDEYAIRVKGYDYASVADVPPLILLDGCLIQDHNALLEIDARTFEEISVFRQKFIFGPNIYEGAMILKTKDGNGYESVIYNGNMSIFTIRKPEASKKYFVQRYDGLNKSESVLRLPDDRLQLLWMPELKAGGDKFGIDFFTSDVSGEFEIHLEGITADHRPVSIRKSIVVE